jgi:hypothetical protein
MVVMLMSDESNASSYHYGCLTATQFDLCLLDSNYTLVYLHMYVCMYTAGVPS